MIHHEHRAVKKLSVGHSNLPTFCCAAPDKTTQAIAIKSIADLKKCNLAINCFDCEHENPLNNSARVQFDLPRIWRMIADSAVTTAVGQTFILQWHQW